MTQPIVVGFDGSERARDALALARGLASVLDSDLIVVDAYTPEEWLWSWGTAPLRAEKELREIHAAADAVLAGCDRYEFRSVASPSAAGALHAIAEDEDARLIVVGSSRHGALGRVLLGTVAQAALDAAPCPVLMAPAGWADGAPLRLARIGVGFDDTPEARSALEAAHGLAARTGGSLEIVWAAHLVARALPHAFAGYLEPDYFEKVRGEVQERLDRAVAGVRGDVPVRAELASGDTVGVLADRSAHLDLLVLGSRGYGPLRRVLLGSVSSAVVNRARCPVLVIGRGTRPLEREPDHDAEGERSPAGAGSS